MIDLCTWSTSNGRKVAIAQRGMGLGYRVHPIAITKGEQSSPTFAAISTNARTPAIVDHAAGPPTPAFEKVAR